MPTERNSIILDTNLWISFLLMKDYSKLDKIFSNNLLTLLFSEELLNEFIEVAKRPYFNKYFSLSNLEELLMQIRNSAEFINVISNIKVCRDPKDNFLLALAKDGKADYLLSGDKHLLELKKFGKTKIITITGFFDEMKNNS